VAFYQESNGIPGLQTGPGGDTLLQTVAPGSGWQWSFSTTGVPAGTYTYYALATDNDGVTSAVGTSATSTAVTVQDPASESWAGTGDDHWDNAANWSLGLVPGPQTVAVFSGSPGRPVTLDQDTTVGGVDIQSSGWTLGLGSHTLSVGTGGLHIAGGSSPTSTVDVGTGALIVTYGSGSSPISDIRGWVAGGYDAGAWDGQGILSSQAASNYPAAVGYIDNATDEGGDGTHTVKVKYTWLGDANCDGVVDIQNDFSAYFDGLNGLGTGWAFGDFNHDGIINIQDDFSAYFDGLNMQGAPLGAGGLVAVSEAAPASPVSAIQENGSAAAFVVDSIARSAEAAPLARAAAAPVLDLPLPVAAVPAPADPSGAPIALTVQLPHEAGLMTPAPIDGAGRAVVLTVKG
jgi:hypothetical protein